MIRIKNKLEEKRLKLIGLQDELIGVYKALISHTTEGYKNIECEVDALEKCIYTLRVEISCLENIIDDYNKQKLEQSQFIYDALRREHEEMMKKEKKNV